MKSFSRLAWAPMCVVAACLLAAAFLPWRKDDQAGIVVDPETLHLNGFADGKPMTALLKFRNLSGKNPVRIIGAGNFCTRDGCVATEGLPVAIPPDGSADFPIRVTASHNGELDFEVPIYTDQATQSDLTVKVHCSVTRPLVKAEAGVAP